MGLKAPKRIKVNVDRYTCNNCDSSEYYLELLPDGRIKANSYYVCLTCEKEYCILCWASVPGTDYLCPDFPRDNKNLDKWLTGEGDGE